MWLPQSSRKPGVRISAALGGIEKQRETCAKERAIYFCDPPAPSRSRRVFLEGVEHYELEAKTLPAKDAPPVLKKSPIEDMTNIEYSEMIGATRHRAALRRATRQPGASQHDIEEWMRANSPGIPSEEIEARQEEQFGTTFVVRTYAVEAEGESPHFDDLLMLEPQPHTDAHSRRPAR